MREAQEYPAMQLLLLMQRISHPATTTLKERQANQHQMPLAKQGRHICLTLIGGPRLWTENFNQIHFFQVCFLFIINHPAADSCSWVCPIFTCLNPCIKLYRAPGSTVHISSSTSSSTSITFMCALQDRVPVQFSWDTIRNEPCICLPCSKCPRESNSC